jgi:hypothetical protein
MTTHDAGCPVPCKPCTCGANDVRSCAMRVVSGCSDCPLWELEHDSCGHPDGHHWMVDQSVPAWCPLRVEPLTIVLQAEREKDAAGDPEYPAE